MKRLAALLAICAAAAQASDAERQARERAVAEAEARRHALERDAVKQRSEARIQNPVLRLPNPSAGELYKQGEALEREGKGVAAVETYRKAAASGSGPAARRLAEIYGSGIHGVARDHDQSRMWRQMARTLGDK